MLIACKRCHRQYDVGSLESGRHVRCFCGEITEVPVERSMPTKMAHCFSCGGPIADGSHDCSYCGGSVSLAMRGSGNTCPECFVRLAKDASFCGACGVEIAVTSVVKALTSVRCPRCKGELAECEGEGMRFTECLACGGLWLDEAFFQNLVKERRTQGAAGAQGKAFWGSSTTQARVPEETIKYLPCPSCSELMQRRMFGQGSGVVLDWCRGHGVWFDAKELEDVLQWSADEPDRAHWKSPAKIDSAKAGSVKMRELDGFRSEVGGIRREQTLIDVALNIFSSLF